MAFPEDEHFPQQVKFSAAVAMALVVGGVAFGGGAILGARSELVGSSVYAITGNAQPEGVDFSPVWKAWHVIDERFVPASVSTSSIAAASTTDPTDRRVWGMIQGLAGSLDDPYSYFLPPAEQKQFQADMSGSFEGVGMEIAVRDQVLTVVSPLRGSPAERAGIKAGDRILEIDDMETYGVDITTAVSRIRGKKGTPVKLLVARDTWTEPQEISVIRDVINVPIVTTSVHGDVFVIELASFTANSPALFRGALREFVESGKTRLVLDVRGNPGGYLDASVEMASWFLPSGQIVVTEDYADHQDNVIHRSRGYDIFNENLRMVILVDRGSASASEILALALRGHGKATLVGMPTFGKGSVQELIDITSDTALKLTVARWLGPNGEPIPHSGIVPDVEVEMKEKDVEQGRDPQLDKAIEILQ